MKNKILLGIVIFLSLVLIFLSLEVKKTYFEPLPLEKGEEPITIRLLDKSSNTIESIHLEDYIIGVVASEMPATFEIEALKAQAVAARSYALYKKESRKDLDYDLVIGVSDQAYSNNEKLLMRWGLAFFTNYLKIRDAVLATKGEILTYEGKVINAFYFSMSNGYTEDSSLVFSEQLPYLERVESRWDNSSLENFEVNKTISKKEFCSLLEVTCEEIDIQEIKRSDSNRVLTIKINGKEMKGTEVRTALNLRSTDFDITVNENDVIITTRGFGHGVGMSQYGANGMAKEGKNYQEILTHYYKNTEITKK